MFRPSLAIAIFVMLVPPTAASARNVKASAQSQPPAAGVAVKKPRTAMQRRAGYRAQAARAPSNCGEFMYWKDGKCNDARNKPSK
jgi:hypothetical protein